MRTGTRISGRRAITLQSAFVAALLGMAPLGASSAAVTDPGTSALDAAASAAVIEALPLEPSTEVTAPEVADPAPLEAPSAPQETLLGRGSASYYAAKFHGRRTASGETFNNRAMTAAHRTLPFGTRVRVTNPSSGASVVVRINDRGPFTKGRMIDVSRAAAEQLGLIAPGHATVELALIGR
jgi:rare lipoprotein A